MATPPLDLISRAESVSPSLAAWMIASWNYTPEQKREEARRRRTERQAAQLTLPITKGTP